MLSRLFIDALWSLAGKGLTFLLSPVMFIYVSVTFSCGILSQVWYLAVSIPDLCHPSFFGDPDLIEVSLYLQDILFYRCTLSCHESKWL